jgi:hypothetical protein
MVFIIYSQLMGLKRWKYMRQWILRNVALGYRSIILSDNIICIFLILVWCLLRSINLIIIIDVNARILLITNNFIIVFVVGIISTTTIVYATPTVTVFVVTDHTIYLIWLWDLNQRIFKTQIAAAIACTSLRGIRSFSLIRWKSWINLNYILLSSTFSHYKSLIWTLAQFLNLF